VRAALLLAAALAGPAAAADRPAPPASRVDPAACTWVWAEMAGFGLWTERCALSTGLWRIVADPKLPGLVLMADDTPMLVAVQAFAKPAAAGIEAILPALVQGGYVPADDCVFAPVALRPAARTVATFEIVPVGARLAAFEATPEDLIPDPPCGAYGWSTHGVRCFVSDLRRPGTILYIDEGQDGTLIAPETLTVLR
jgi:hypothetical protein